MELCNSVISNLQQNPPNVSKSVYDMAFSWDQYKEFYSTSGLGKRKFIKLEARENADLKFSQNIKF